MNLGWANGVLKCVCLGLPISGLKSVSLFWYEGCFEWEGGRNGKIEAVMTTRIWKISTVALVSALLQGRRGSLHLCSHDHSKHILCCIQKSFKSDYLLVLEIWKIWPFPAAVEVEGRIWVSRAFTSHSPCSFRVELRFLWAVLKSCATTASGVFKIHLSLLLPFLKKLCWQLLPKITFRITSLKCFNGNKAHILTLHSTAALWIRTSHCISRC